jgi:hypothetical protein
MTRAVTRTLRLLAAGALAGAAFTPVAAVASPLPTPTASPAPTTLLAPAAGAATTAPPVSADQSAPTTAAEGAKAAPDAVPGNNGTVKIHDGAEEPTPEPRNQPHVCDFHVHGFGFDAGQMLDLTFLSWPPTGDRSEVLNGELKADATGEGRWPETGSVTLPDGHYKMVVDTGDGRPTRDKHKVFWVDCTPESTPTGSTDSQDASTLPGNTAVGSASSGQPAPADQSSQVDAATAVGGDTPVEQSNEATEADQSPTENSDDPSMVMTASKLAATGATPVVLLTAVAGVALVVAGFVIRRRAARS